MAEREKLARRPAPGEATAPEPATEKRGRGRPAGGIALISRAAQKKARRNGRLPCELLCEWAQLGKMGEVILSIEQRMDAAKAAAPYYSPRLSSTKMTGADDGPVKIDLDLSQLKNLPLDKIEALEAVLAELAGGPALSTLEEAANESGASAQRYEDTLH